MNTEKRSPQSAESLTNRRHGHSEFHIQDTVKKKSYDSLVSHKIEQLPSTGPLPEPSSVYKPNTFNKIGVLLKINKRPTNSIKDVQHGSESIQKYTRRKRSIGFHGDLSKLWQEYANKVSTAVQRLDTVSKSVNSTVEADSSSRTTSGQETEVEDSSEEVPSYNDKGEEDEEEDDGSTASDTIHSSQPHVVTEGVPHEAITRAPLSGHAGNHGLTEVLPQDLSNSSESDGLRHLNKSAIPGEASDHTQVKQLWKGNMYEKNKVSHKEQNRGPLRDSDRYHTSKHGNYESQESTKGLVHGQRTIILPAGYKITGIEPIQDTQAVNKPEYKEAGQSSRALSPESRVRPVIRGVYHTSKVGVPRRVAGFWQDTPDPDQEELSKVEKSVLNNLPVKSQHVLKPWIVPSRPQQWDMMSDQGKLEGNNKNPVIADAKNKSHKDRRYRSRYDRQKQATKLQKNHIDPDTAFQPNIVPFDLGVGKDSFKNFKDPDKRDKSQDMDLIDHVYSNIQVPHNNQEIKTIVDSPTETDQGVHILKGHETNYVTQDNTKMKEAIPLPPRSKVWLAAEREKERRRALENALRESHVNHKNSAQSRNYNGDQGGSVSTSYTSEDGHFPILLDSDTHKIIPVPSSSEAWAGGQNENEGKTPRKPPFMAESSNEDHIPMPARSKAWLDAHQGRRTNLMGRVSQENNAHNIVETQVSPKSKPSFEERTAQDLPVDARSHAWLAWLAQQKKVEMVRQALTDASERKKGELTNVKDVSRTLDPKEDGPVQDDYISMPSKSPAWIKEHKTGEQTSREASKGKEELKIVKKVPQTLGTKENVNLKNTVTESQKGIVEAVEDDYIPMPPKSKVWIAEHKVAQQSSKETSKQKNGEVKNARKVTKTLDIKENDNPKKIGTESQTGIVEAVEDDYIPMPPKSKVWIAEHKVAEINQRTRQRSETMNPEGLSGSIKAVPSKSDISDGNNTKHSAESTRTTALTNAQLGSPMAGPIDEPSALWGALNTQQGRRRRGKRDARSDIKMANNGRPQNVLDELKGSSYAPNNRRTYDTNKLNRRTQPKPRSQTHSNLKEFRSNVETRPVISSAPEERTDTFLMNGEPIPMPPKARQKSKTSIRRFISKKEYHTEKIGVPKKVAGFWDDTPKSDKKDVLADLQSFSLSKSQSSSNTNPKIQRNINTVRKQTVSIKDAYPLDKSRKWSGEQQKIRSILSAQEKGNTITSKDTDLGKLSPKSFQVLHNEPLSKVRRSSRTKSVDASVNQETADGTPDQSKDVYKATVFKKQPRKGSKSRQLQVPHEQLPDILQESLKNMQDRDTFTSEQQRPQSQLDRREADRELSPGTEPQGAVEEHANSSFHSNSTSKTAFQLLNPNFYSNVLTKYK